MMKIPKPDIGDLGKAAGKSILAGALFALGSILVQVLWEQALEHFRGFEVKGEPQRLPDQQAQE